MSEGPQFDDKGQIISTGRITQPVVEKPVDLYAGGSDPDDDPQKYPVATDQEKITARAKLREQLSASTEPIDPNKRIY